MVESPPVEGVAADILAWFKAGDPVETIVVRLNEQHRPNAHGRVGEWNAKSVNYLYRTRVPADVRASIKADRLKSFRGSAAAKAGDRVDAIVDRMLELEAAGRSQEEIARTLNTEGIRSVRGAEWSRSTVCLTLRKHAADRRVGGPKFGAERRSRMARAKDAPVMADVMAWWGQGRSLLSILRELNAAGRFNSFGRPWSSAHLSRAIRSHLDPEALAAFEAEVAERRKTQGKALKAPNPEDAPGYWIRTTRTAVLEEVHGKTKGYTAYLDTQANRYEYRKWPGKNSIDIHFRDPAEHEKYRPVLDTTSKADGP